MPVARGKELYQLNKRLWKLWERHIKILRGFLCVRCFHGRLIGCKFGFLPLVEDEPKVSHSCPYFRARTIVKSK